MLNRRVKTNDDVRLVGLVGDGNDDNDATLKKRNTVLYVERSK